MMIEQATVVRYQNGMALVQCQAKAGCGSCVAQSSCGSKALSALAGEKVAPRFELAVSEPLAVGDRIEIGLSEQRLLTSVAWLYGLPLLVVLLSSLLLSQWIENELVVALGIVISTLATFWGIKARLSEKQAGFIPLFLRKI